MTPLVLKTERTNVLLREYTADDADAIYQVIEESREHLSRWGDVTSSKYPDLESVLHSIRHPLSPGRLRMGIWHNNEFAGGINMQPLAALYHAEIGYWLGKRFTGRGLMRTALRAMVMHGFESIEYYYLKANVRVENIASQKVLEDIGFRKISVADVYINYALCAHEWGAR